MPSGGKRCGCAGKSCRRSSAPCSCKDEGLSVGRISGGDEHVSRVRRSITEQGAVATWPIPKESNQGHAVESTKGHELVALLASDLTLPNRPGRYRSLFCS